MLLESKVAVIYGAGGAVGIAVARDGATLFVAGRHPASVQPIAAGINGAEPAARLCVDQRYRVQRERWITQDFSEDDSR